MEILEIKIDKIFSDRYSDSFFTILALGEKVSVYYLQLLGLDCVSSTPPIRKIKEHPDKLGIDYERMVLRISKTYAKELFPFEDFD